MTITSHRGRIKLEGTHQILKRNRGSQKDTVPECFRDRAHLLRSVPGRESYHRRDLKQTNLEGVRRADFHTEEVPVSELKRSKENETLPEGDVSVQSERNSVHELRGVRYESEQGDPEELLIDPRSFKHDIHHTHKQLCTKRSVNNLSGEWKWTNLQ